MSAAISSGMGGSSSNSSRPGPDLVNDPANASTYEEYWSYSVELRDGAWVITEVERY